MYKTRYLPEIKGFSKKIARATDNLKAERVNLSIAVGVDYLAQADTKVLLEVSSLLEETEAKLQALSKRFRAVIKALER